MSYNLLDMSGHSKWAQIKRSKGALDAKRGLVFSKLAKKITIAAKQGNSSDPTLNYLLRAEIDKAKAQGLPNENIERAIKKAFSNDTQTVEEVIYEGYGPFGTAFLVECATDNKNRTVSEIKHIFSKNGGSLGAMGSVGWQFQTKGQILVERSANLEHIEFTAIEAGAEDIRESSEGLEVYTTPETITTIQQALEKAGAKIAQWEIIKESSQGIDLSLEQKTQVDKLFAELEEYEDTIAVHTSANL